MEQAGSSRGQEFSWCFVFHVVVTGKRVLLSSTGGRCRLLTNGDSKSHVPPVYAVSIPIQRLLGL